MGAEFYYIILFDEKIDDDYDPLLLIKKDEIVEFKNGNSDTMHVWDSNMNGVIKAVEFVMHLPRGIFDIYSSHVHLEQNVHYIIIYPNIKTDILLSSIPSLNQDILVNALIIYSSSNSKDLATELELLYKPILGKVSFEQLNEEFLLTCWEKLGEYVDRIPYPYEKSKRRIPNLLSGEMLKALPVLFSNRLKQEKALLDEIKKEENVELSCISYQGVQIVDRNTMMILENKGATFSDFEKLYDPIFNAESRKDIINLTITVPGISKPQIRYGGYSETLPEIEQRAIRIMGIHNAIDSMAAILEFPTIDDEWYQILNELEIHCRVDGANNNNEYVWRVFRKLGKTIRKSICEKQYISIIRAKNISVFSNFPIGLAIFDEYSDPISCYKTMIYRPLTPLTRSFTIEMGDNRKVFLKQGCKIAFAECILSDSKTNESIINQTRSIVHNVKNLESKDKCISCVYEKTDTIKKFKDFLNSNRKADILVVSAHGYYNPELNQAGIMIGNEFWMANDNDFVLPPVVILCACHSAPRGTGAVSVGDLFIRAGAVTVLSSLIPIAAQRNAILISRMFVYINEALTGRRNYSSLAELWEGIIAQNAVHEISMISLSFQEWLYSKNQMGITHIEDFCFNRAKYLRKGHMYEDTIRVLRQMLKEENLEKYDQILKVENIFPESCFYQLLGYADRVYFQSET